MSSHNFSGLVAKLPDACVIRIEGSDAAKVLNNLCTNDVLKLKTGAACEAFVTDVRGWVVAHGAVIRTENAIHLLGSHPAPERVCAHIDRYIIREDARVSDLTGQYHVDVLAGAGSSTVLAELSGSQFSPGDSAFQFAFHDAELIGCALPVIGPESYLLCGTIAQKGQLDAALAAAGAADCQDEEFQRLRIGSFWPMMPDDIREKTLPQELDRDARAISFTKGCYLGQETIARLDARGQLQKKLCMAEVLGQATVAPNAVLHDQGKEVGTITSAAYDASSQRWLCLALMRRGYFEVGVELSFEGGSFRIL